MKTRVIILLVLVAILTLGGCNPPAGEINPETGDVVATSTGKYITQELSAGLAYFKDETTGLCFAVYTPTATDELKLLTSVPCDTVGGKALKFQSRWTAE